MTVHPQSGNAAVQDKGLRGGALGVVSSVIVGVASTAPAYSLAATLGLIVFANTTGRGVLPGVKAPAIVLLAFVPMFFIALAYQQLNKAEPDCGTTFTWASRAFHPVVGWIGGWGIIAADIIVMANLAQIAGQYGFTFAAEVGRLFGADWSAVAALASSTGWTMVAGVVWIAIMTWICYIGIEVSANLQKVLLTVEVVILVVFAVFALVKVYTHTAEPYSLIPNIDWFNPLGLNFGQVVAPAMLSAIFIYWGWDTAVSVNEEADDPASTPGKAAVVSTLLLLVTYALVTVASIAFAGVGTTGIGLGNGNNASDVFSAIGPTLFGHGFGGTLLLLLLSFSILTSSAASTQTTILPTARTSLSMAVYKALPERFARIHPKYLTPTWSTVWMGLVSAIFFIVFGLISANLLTALIGSIGLMIALYYGFTGAACVWFYRRTMWRSVRLVILQGLFPAAGAVMLFLVFGYGLYKYLEPSNLTDSHTGKNVTIFGAGAVGVVGLVGIGVGIVLMIVWWIMRPDFFRGRTIVRSDDLVLTTTGTFPTFGLPDSGDMPTVIAPNLSNLPAGRTALNADTHEPYDPRLDRTGNGSRRD